MATAAAERIRVGTVVRDRLWGEANTYWAGDIASLAVGS